MPTLYDCNLSEANRTRHGVSFSLANAIDWPCVWCAPDVREDRRALREIGYVSVGGRVYCATFTQRGSSVRLVSLRKANNREIDRYEQAGRVPA
jgi:uncharacterized DUF497 family protein